MKASTHSKCRYIGGCTKYAREGRLIRPNTFSTQLDEEIDRLFVVTNLAAATYHRIPRDHIPLRHAPEDPESIVEPLVFQVSANQCGVRNYIWFASVLECTLGFFDGAQFGVVVKKRAANEDIGYESRLCYACMELPADLEATKSSGGMKSGTEGELVGSDVEGKNARKEGDGIVVTVVASEGANDSCGGDQVPVGCLVEQLASAWECAAVQVGPDELGGFYGCSRLEELGVCLLRAEKMEGERRESLQWMWIEVRKGAYEFGERRSHAEVAIDASRCTGTVREPILIGPYVRAVVWPHTRANGNERCIRCRTFTNLERGPQPRRQGLSHEKAHFNICKILLHVASQPYYI